ncbi:Hypothetical protein SRAE_2000499600 [Strongyloides ratti]|uniref:Cystatin domain-containing protein n=1 Tax=Strongyloides ratti TaxID=34506 RepID=A0A090LKX5_STRRB|nr:Hypothetical protein SRAE_2000499600 [Strongyloides ratti]CEF70363.1 Hypothetical protein SRAE_2000499600 [Strongyloides ratti]
MKYLIPLLLILFISIVTVFNKKIPENIDNGKWKKRKTDPKDPEVLRLGLRGVNRYNKDHLSAMVIFINVTATYEIGDICKKNKRVKLIAMIQDKKKEFRKYQIFNTTLKGELDDKRKTNGPRQFLKTTRIPK